MVNFSDLAWLFTCDNRNRGILRMNFDEAGMLWNAAMASPGNFLEVGRYKGGSCALITEALKNHRESGEDYQLLSIDIQPQHDRGVDRMLREYDFVHLAVGNSHTYDSFVHAPYSFALLDGDHTFKGILEDVRAHWNKVKDGGLIFFHDAIPNDGMKYLAKGRRTFKKNYWGGIHHTFKELIRNEVASEWARAGSSVVLTKLADVDHVICDSIIESFKTSGLEDKEL